MLAVLGASRALVVHSERGGWSDEKPGECGVVLDQMMACLINPKRTYAQNTPAFNSHQQALFKRLQSQTAGMIHTWNCQLHTMNWKKN